MLTMAIPDVEILAVRLFSQKAYVLMYYADANHVLGSRSGEFEWIDSES